MATDPTAQTEQLACHYSPLHATSTTLLSSLARTGGNFLESTPQWRHPISCSCRRPRPPRNPCPPASSPSPTTAQPATGRTTTRRPSRRGASSSRCPGTTRQRPSTSARSGVVLEVAPSAQLLGGTRQQDYPPKSRRWYVVLAENTTGAGEINDQGGAFAITPNAQKNTMLERHRGLQERRGPAAARLVGFIDSTTDVRIHDITLNQPAYWCLHFVRCDNSLIRNVSIYGDFGIPNNDGIDIEDSNNTIITDCHIDTKHVFCIIIPDSTKSGTGSKIAVVWSSYN